MHLSWSLHRNLGIVHAGLGVASSSLMLHVLVHNCFCWDICNHWDLGCVFPPILTAALILWFMISSICSLLTCHGICTGGEKIESGDWLCCWWRQRVGVTACLLMFGDPNNSSMWTSFYFVWSYWANLCKTIGSRVFSWCTFGRFDSMFYV
jgi:hypothetical protein